MDTYNKTKTASRNNMKIIVTFIFVTCNKNCYNDIALYKLEKKVYCTMIKEMVHCHRQSENLQSKIFFIITFFEKPINVGRGISTHISNKCTQEHNEYLK